MMDAAYARTMVLLRIAYPDWICLSNWAYNECIIITIKLTNEMAGSFNEYAINMFLVLLIY